MNLVLSYALNALWQVPLVVCAGWLVSRLCRGLHPRVLHRVWPTTLLLAVIAPGLAAVRGWAMASTHAGAAGIRLLASGAEALPQEHIFAHGSLALSRSWSIGLASFYIIFIAFAVLRLLRGLIKIQNLVRFSTPVTLTPGHQQIWERCLRVLNARYVSLRSSDEMNGPAVVGWRRPVLLLPSSFLAETPPDELLAALAHECAHIVRRDYLLNLLGECLALPIAWHPVVALLKKQIAQTREVACDQMVADTVMQPTLYAGALLRLASRVPALLPGQNNHTVRMAVGIFDANILEKRIMNLKRKRNALGWTKKLVIGVGAIVIVGGCVASAVALTVEVDQTQTPSTAQADTAHVYRPGGDVSAPQLIHSVDPDFPAPKEQPSDFKGVVVLKMVVNRKGLPTSVEVVRSLDPKFDASAIKAVKQYRFKPAIKDGQPVNVSVNIEVNFQKY